MLFGEVNVGQRKSGRTLKRLREGLKNDLKAFDSGQIINKTKTSKPLLKTDLNGGRR